MTRPSIFKMVSIKSRSLRNSLNRMTTIPSNIESLDANQQMIQQLLQRSMHPIRAQRSPNVDQVFKRQHERVLR